MRSSARSWVVATLVDAGPLYAVADEDDALHEPSLRAIRDAARPLLVPDLVVTEVCHLVGARLGTAAEVRFVGALAAGDLTVAHVEAGDWLRIAELVARYDDLPLGTVDASVVAIAERLRIATLITLDARHFRVVRPAHAAAFDLRPAR